MGNPGSHRSVPSEGEVYIAFSFFTECAKISQTYYSSISPQIYIYTVLTEESESRNIMRISIVIIINLVVSIFNSLRVTYN